MFTRIERDSFEVVYVLKPFLALATSWQISSPTFHTSSSLISRQGLQVKKGCGPSHVLEVIYKARTEKRFNSVRQLFADLKTPQKDKWDFRSRKLCFPVRFAEFNVFFSCQQIENSPTIYFCLMSNNNNPSPAFRSKPGRQQRAKQDCACLDVWKCVTFFPYAFCVYSSSTDRRFNEDACVVSYLGQYQFSIDDSHPWSSLSQVDRWRKDRWNDNFLAACRFPDASYSKMVLLRYAQPLSSHHLVYWVAILGVRVCVWIQEKNTHMRPRGRIHFEILSRHRFVQFTWRICYLVTR